MMTARAIGYLLLACTASFLAAQNSGREKDERDIRLVIQQRETAWNSGDVAAYGQLLTDDADILSASGRAAEGRKAILDLYVEQRAGIYKGGITATPVESIRLLRAVDGSTLPVRRGLLTLVVNQRARPLVDCIHARYTRDSHPLRMARIGGHPVLPKLEFQQHPCGNLL